MKEAIGIIVALALGFGGGYHFASKDKTNDGAMKHKDDHTHTSHDQMEVSGAVPVVDLTVHEDPKSGYNAQISLTNFKFSPENVSTGHTEGEGHAHIYIDGVKINRVYSEWYHLGDLDDGAKVEVRISSNDHKELTSNGNVISDEEVIGGDSMMMEHDGSMGDDSMKMEQ